jgi:hypothetical protein
MARAAGGTSQRLKPGAAMERSRLKKGRDGEAATDIEPPNRALRAFTENKTFHLRSRKIATARALDQ